MGVDPARIDHAIGGVVDRSPGSGASAPSAVITPSRTRISRPLARAAAPRGRS